MGSQFWEIPFLFIGYSRVSWCLIPLKGRMGGSERLDSFELLFDYVKFSRFDGECIL